MIQYCPKRKKGRDFNRRKGVNRDGTQNYLITITEIIQKTISSLQIYHTDDNIIRTQVQKPRMVRQIGVNEVATDNDTSVIRPRS